ncbi:MAG: TolC family protein [Bdellovibrionales bacterium]|nr:TolC family protein [Bdellovibrionales bacterium]
MQIGENRSSWNDPLLKVSAKNFPIESFSYDQTPMTGIEFGVSQQIPLTAKYKKIREAYLQFSESVEYQAKDLQRQLTKNMWEILIENKNIKEEIGIIDENIHWITNIVQVSERLYANGTISQQALLDLKIRQSELEALLNNKKIEAKQQIDILEYLLGVETASIQMESIPWHILEQVDENPLDTKERFYELERDAKKLSWDASKRDKIPDINVGLSYTLRSDIDQNGDFVSAMIGLPLSLYGKKSSAIKQALYDKNIAELNLLDYKKHKDSELRQQKHEMEKISFELSVLNERTIEFAKNSREITSKSYSLGKSTYIELLQSELKLQELLLQRSVLEANLRDTKVAYKFLRGEKLHE